MLIRYQYITFLLMLFICCPVVHALSTAPTIPTALPADTVLKVFHRTYLRGTVIEQPSGDPLPFCTIRLMSQADSTLVKGAVSESDGTFEVGPIPAGSYILAVTSIGYKTTTLPLLVSANSGNINLGYVDIYEDIISLDEVQVKSQATNMVARGDTLEYSMGAYRMAEGSVLEDWLKSLPGVEITETGKILFQGREVKRILIDGKDFFRGDLTVSVKNIPLGITDKLQIINHKSELAQVTGIDDGEDEVVINISIKKGLKKGILLNVNAGVGNESDRIATDHMLLDVNSMIIRLRDDSQFGVVVNGNNINNQKFGETEEDPEALLSTRKLENPGVNSSYSSGVTFAKEAEALKMSGDILFGSSETDIFRRSHRQNFLIDSVTFQTDTTITHRSARDVKFNAQVEYKPTSDWMFRFNPEVVVSSGKTTIQGFGTLTTIDGTRINRNFKSNILETEEVTVGGVFTAVKEFEKEGRKLSVNVDSRYMNSVSEGANIMRFFLYRNNREITRIDHHVRPEITMINSRLFVAFIEPLWKRTELQISYWMRQNNRETIRNSYNSDEHGEYTMLDPMYSKSLENAILTQQLALSLRGAKDKISYVVGADINPSTINSTRFIRGGSHNGSDSTLYEYPVYQVWNYAPNLRLIYTFSRYQNLRIDFRARIVSPSIFQLDPTEDFTTPHNIRRGNPNLIPSFINILKLQYSNFNRASQRSFIVTVDGQYLFNDIIMRTIFEEREDQPGTGIRITEYLNESGSWNIYGTMTISHPMGSNFHINNYLRIQARNEIGYSYMHRIGSERNVSTTTTLIENLGVTYRNDWVALQIRADYARNNTLHSIKGREVQLTSEYGCLFNTRVDLPYKASLAMEVRIRGFTGFADGYNNHEALCNLEVSKSLFGNAASIRVRMNDILARQASVMRNITTHFVEDQTYNQLSRYVMLYFVYRLNAMPEE